MPKNNGQDFSIRRRFQIILFLRIFKEYEKDNATGEKPGAGLSGNLIWTIRGCLKWQVQRLGPSWIVKDQLDHYQQNMDSVAKFVDAKLVLYPAGRVKSSELY